MLGNQNKDAILSSSHSVGEIYGTSSRSYVFADGFTFLQKQWRRHESGLFLPEANFKIARATAGSCGNRGSSFKTLRAFRHYTDQLDVKCSRSLGFFI